MKIIIRGLTMRILSLIVAILALFNITPPWIEPEPPEGNTHYENVLVHGLLGWGSYDEYYKALPYWGMLGGDVVEQLELKGFDCCCASVDPTGSAWDRACELYAQLAGTRVDYGKAHSEKYDHERYGEDFAGKVLTKKLWSSENKINLYGHSFGGVTIRLLAELMQNGNDDERTATVDGTLSELFTGGKGDYIYSITALAAPHNGTSAYESEQWAPTDDTTLAQLERAYNVIDPTGVLFDMVVGFSSDSNGEILPDTAHYDLHIDAAMEINETITTLPDVYYFSYAASATEAGENGFQVPKRSEMEPLFFTRSIGMGKTTFVTPAGHVIDEKWFENDGLVNTYSALAPLGEQSVTYDSENVEKGIWNVMPVYQGDHTSFMGDLTNVHDILPFYEELFTMINML